MFRRRKVCKFCSDKIDDINYKDVRMLMPFVPERAKVLPRRISGTCALHQRKLRTAIMRAARSCALISVHDGVTGPWKSFSENTSTTWAAVARSSRWPRATRATTCCRGSWRCWRPRATRSTSSASGRSWRRARPRRRGRRKPWPHGWRLVEISIARRVGETDQLYGSVTAVDIADYLKSKGFEIDRRKLILPEPIKTIGDHKVPLKLHRDVTVPLVVKVVKEGAAAQ